LTEREQCRSKYTFGRTLGAGTYGIVREADGPDGKCAVKIILKKNVRGNEQMVYDEMAMLQKMKHKHIVKFMEWFESKVCWRENTCGMTFLRLTCEGN
jgi:calcium/calmodulin-dependent protein kinase I